MGRWKFPNFWIERRSFAHILSAPVPVPKSEKKNHWHEIAFWMSISLNNFFPACFTIENYLLIITKYPPYLLYWNIIYHVLFWRKRKANSPLSDGLSRKRAVLGEHNPQPLREHNRQTEQLREHNPQPLRENNRQTEQHNERLLKTHSHQKPQHQDRPFTSNSHQTEQLFEDMGVKYISQVGLDTVTGIPKETTPAVWSTDGCQPDVACSQLPEPPGVSLFEPHYGKTCLRGLRPVKTQTDLVSYRD